MVAAALVLVVGQLHLSGDVWPVAEFRVSQRIDAAMPERIVTYNRNRAAEFVLALMYLDMHDGTRAWKGYPWDVLDALHESGLISDPKSKAKSVVFTEEGRVRAEMAFATLLAQELPPRRRPEPSKAETANRLSQMQTALVERLFAPICVPHPDPAVSSKLRHGFRIEGSSVVLFESRPGFRAPHEWQEHDVAKFKFVKSRDTWQLYCQFRDLKWHAYEPMSESPDLAALVREVQSDPTGIFWG